MLPFCVPILVPFAAAPAVVLVLPVGCAVPLSAACSAGLLGSADAPPDEVPPQPKASDATQAAHNTLRVPRGAE
jgi:hypothetical protein